MVSLPPSERALYIELKNHLESLNSSLMLLLSNRSKPVLLVPIIPFLVYDDCIPPRDTSPHQDSTGTAPSGTPPPMQPPPPPQTRGTQSHSAPTPLKRPTVLVGCGGVSSSLGARPLHRAEEPPVMQKNYFGLSRMLLLKKRSKPVLIVLVMPFLVGCGGVAASLGARPLHRAEEPPRVARHEEQPQDDQVEVQERERSRSAFGAGTKQKTTPIHETDSDLAGSGIGLDVKNSHTTIKSKRKSENDREARLPQVPTI